MIKLKQKARMMKDILNVDCMDKDKGLPSYCDNYFDLTKLFCIFASNIK